MKKLLLLFLLIPACAYAWGVLPLGGGVVSGDSALCSSCTPGDPADIFCEDFNGSTTCATGEASVCQCAWTEVEESGGTGTFTTDGLTIGVTNGTGVIEYTRDISAAAPAVYVKFDLTINSESLADGGSVRLMGVDTNELKLRQTSGVLYLDLDYNTETGLVSGTTAISGTVSIEIASDESAETMQLWVDDVSQGSSQGQWAGFDILLLGVYQPGVLLNYTITNIQVDDDTMP